MAEARPHPRNEASFPLRPFILTFLAVTVWINVSEILRYFVFVMPMTRAALPMVPGVAPMNPPVFVLWGVWDTILTIVVTWFCWLHMERFGRGLRACVAAGTMLWLAIFVIFWFATVNMNLAPASTPLVALPLAWFEMVVASVITVRCFQSLGA